MVTAWYQQVAPGGGSVFDTLFDNTFAGIHRLEWFDWALLIPYFAVLVSCPSTACTATR